MPFFPDSATGRSINSAAESRSEAKYQLHHEGKLVFEGSAVEVARRQPDGTWLYIIDHPNGASLPSAWANKSD